MLQIGEGLFDCWYSETHEIVDKVFEQPKYGLCTYKRISQDLFTLTFNKFKSTNVNIVKRR